MQSPTVNADPWVNYSVARDFVEAPSQMLENWCWEPKVLEKMSSHFETKKPLPADLIEKIIKRYVNLSPHSLDISNLLSSRYVNVGLFYLRQLFFANFDIKVHTDKSRLILALRRAGLTNLHRCY